jgi:hypothetical protein
MKIREIIREDESPDEQLGKQFINTNLVPVLMFLRSRADDKELSPKMSTNSLIQLVRNAGDHTFDYDALVTSNEENPAVKELIKSFNEQEIVLKSSFDSASDSDTVNNGEEDADVAQNPEATVDQMAKSAASDRGAPI